MSRIVSVGLLIALALVLAVIAFVLSGSARAHENYPPRCCGGRDCAPVPGVGQVLWHEGGWFIVMTGETIPFDKTEPSFDLRFHRCQYMNGPSKGKTRCLFAPDAGT